MQAMPYVAEIPLANVAWEAINGVPDASDLSPSEYARMDPAIVEEAGAGHYVVDGFHRIAGMVNWAQGEGIDARTVMIRVVVTTDEDDEDLVADAADGFSGTNEESVEELIRQSGYA